MNTKLKTNPVRAVSFLLMLLGACTMVLPFIWMISTSLKQSNLVFTIPPQWIPNPVYWENYVHVWKASNLIVGIKNSGIISIAVLIIFTLTSTMAAFAFSKLNFWLKNVIFVMMLSTLMMPMVVLLVPRYIVFAKINWIDTLWPLIIVPPACYMNVLFFMRQYMTGLPNELMGAAKIDGCGYFKIYWKIFLPLCKPAIVANTIMLFMTTWNDYLNPLIFTHSDTMQTIQVAIAMMNSHYQQQTDIPLVMTASFIALLPVFIIFVICQKHFTESFAMTGLKA